MAHKAIREADGKRMLARLFKDYSDGKYDNLRQNCHSRTRYRHGEAAESIQVANY